MKIEKKRKKKIKSTAFVFDTDESTLYTFKV